MLISKPKHRLAIAGLLWVCVASPTGCDKSFPPDTQEYRGSCGLFSLATTSEKPFNFPVPQLKCSLSFTFDPQMCSGTCTCRQVAIVQMIRFTDNREGHEGEYFQPTDRQEDRMVHDHPNAAMNGWAIDRGEEFKWAYYARYDDGNWWDSAHDQFDWHVRLGANNSAAIIKDAIHDERSDYRVDVVDVPVCIDDASACNQAILGYYGWYFGRSGGSGEMSAVTRYTALWMRDAFALAVAEWNKQDDNHPLVIHGFP